MYQLSVTNETGQLQSVIIGYPDNFTLDNAEIINETQKYYYFSPERPTRERIKKQFAQLITCLQQAGVTVYQPEPIPGITDQLMTRDIGFVIGDTFVVSHMAYPSRQGEWRGIKYILDQIPADKKLDVPDDIFIEGGDIIVDRHYIFVGISQRTSLNGADYLQQHFPNYQVIPLHLKQVIEDEDVLHLDCTFVPVGCEHALIYPQGFKTIPPELRTYKWIEVTKAEQQRLSTNVLSIGPDTVISQLQATRINNQLRAIGLNVIEIDYTDPPKTGGSFRCSSLPLHRLKQ
ncbi:MAG TPA: arginine deiminase family protein [Anaerolineae bacterium]|nr:arginine deiminase family protein [Anaerolineae bacterium]